VRPDQHGVFVADQGGQNEVDFLASLDHVPTHFDPGLGELAPDIGAFLLAGYFAQDFLLAFCHVISFRVEGFTA
jgi:hypothetical protein